MEVFKGGTLSAYKWLQIDGVYLTRSDYLIVKPQKNSTGNVNGSGTRVNMAYGRPLYDVTYFLITYCGVQWECVLCECIPFMSLSCDVSQC